MRELIILIGGLLPFFCSAIGIDSMLNFTEKGKTEFKVSSNSSYREFIKVGISELHVKDGEVVKVPYSRENIDKWSLLVRPARAVIEPSLSKLFTVEHVASKGSLSKQDHAYQLSIIPTPYFAEGEPVSHSVSIAMGFAPVVIVPAEEDKPLNYRIQYQNGGVRIKNNGGTYLRAVLDTCADDTLEDERESCTSVSYVLSGRNLPIQLSDKMKSAKKINVNLSTHKYTYKTALTLKPEQVVESERH
ncbi:hypothetical protein [Vibrio sp. AND4]|uniref:hypothetical protein n=1 Tax=Vibrio sp. AND4 TaxID=314289 RepID=UPI00015F2F20|nr:hypothetical protein [Vibrio sp. AND4]EDP60465.1 hypothetical protein AND4_06094 [Vibrio sp. AND4]